MTSYALHDIPDVENVTISPDARHVRIIDQTQLPMRRVFLDISQREDMYEAIHSLRVRGAPAIGIFAAYSMAVLATGIDGLPYGEFRDRLGQMGTYLDSSRPTAVNLGWAIRRIMAVVDAFPMKKVPEIVSLVCQEAIAIQEEDIGMCRKISSYGLSLVKDGDGILTHCNAGPLATSRYGTALGPLFLGKEKGMTFHVYADETRPLLQGARLTSYELHQAGIDVTLICDNMASLVMKQGRIQACFVGCDRIAANGDVANKIGTSGVAILARHYGIPVYVLGPWSTVDLACRTGDDIEIELRDGDEIKKKFFAEPTAPEGVACYNPAFDVTDHSLISAIVTDRGICRPPFTESLMALS
ncbi:S-methyl-5-thioribose-1-phosphate isomerase [Parasphaerochaeta coccoides]|uniref:Methylthioribose-1-phosphate isomerase n=1 Tax=Parasphaerochaeta coccoides (strain ATCC BAA-1237 / DSM 17374 / SPN1) TaxID=760011 RepID=F4GIA8_PARC1|nr:S-methyl-5-thioribose-1-phosphate isomerase [Parasphaerochaeta coccoides]AEC01267.1 methylthioribose-1-phosphate isomerase [Parasphaerochaeta coccoides DSM 17374]